MALFTAHRPSARRPGLLMLWSVAGFGAAISLFSLSTVFWLSRKVGLAPIWTTQRRRFPSTVPEAA